MVSPRLSDGALANIAAQAAKLQIPIPTSDPEGTEYGVLRDSVGRSLLQYFTSSSFTVSGPFKSVDDMTFPEKKQADLLLTVEFGVLTDQPRFVAHRDSNRALLAVTSEGDCSVRGTIMFVLWEPLSMQRMWAKTVDVQATTFSCTIRAANGDDYNVQLMNGFQKAYEVIFRDTMTSAERYFDPEEVALVKRQSLELRANKVY